MAKYDTFSDSNILPLAVFTFVADGTDVEATVDTIDYRALNIIFNGNYPGGVGSMDILISDSDDDIVFTQVDSSNILIDPQYINPSSAFTALMAFDDAAINIGYIGKKRYVKYDCSLNTAPGTVITFSAFSQGTRLPYDFEQVIAPL